MPHTMKTLSARFDEIVVVVVDLVTAWGEHLLAVTLTNDQDVGTLPVVLASAFGGMGQCA